MFDDIIRSNSATYHVPESWIRTFIATESSWNPRAFRAEPRINDASYGLMQLLVSTARGLGFNGTPDELYDPATNIALGTKLIAQLRIKYGDDIQAVYSAYNSGSGTSYLSNPTVAQHVTNMLRNFQAVIQEYPVIAETGSFGLIIAGLILWYWTKSKRKEK